MIPPLSSQIVSEGGTSFIISNYIGGDNDSGASGMTTGVDGSVSITGFTSSSSFPVTLDAVQTTNHGGYDVFVYRTQFAMYAKASLVILKL